jgi:hypothetical protein
METKNPLHTHRGESADEVGAIRSDEVGAIRSDEVGANR